MPDVDECWPGKAVINEDGHEALELSLVATDLPAEQVLAKPFFVEIRHVVFPPADVVMYLC